MKMFSKFILINLFSFIVICMTKCPPKTVMGQCSCEGDPDTKVSCRKVDFPNTLVNVTIYSIKLNNVTSRATNAINVKAGELELRGRSTSIADIRPFVAMEPFRVRLINLAEELVYQFFEHKSDKVLQLFIYGNHFNKLDLKFTNYPNVRNIFLVNTPYTPTKINELPSLVFYGLRSLDQINLNNAGIKYLDENSLKLSTKNRVIIDLYDNDITADQFDKANFSNTAETWIDLTYNKIEKFPAHIFEKYIQYEPWHRINLKANPIICECEQVKWIFKYKYDDRMSKGFPLKNVQCKNKGYENLLEMDENDFTDCTSDVLLSNSSSTSTSPIVASSMENDSEISTEVNVLEASSR